MNKIVLACVVLFALAANGACAGTGVRGEARDATVSGERILRAAQDCLRESLAAHYGHVEASASRQPSDIQVPDGALFLRAHALHGVLPASGRAVVLVDMYVDRHLVRSVTVSFDVVVHAPLAFAKPPAATERERPAVARGAWITLSAHAGEVMLESRVQALQDGRIGQTVRVRMPNGAGVLMAQVSGTNRVEVVE